MSDFDFNELDQAINDLCTTLDGGQLDSEVATDIPVQTKQGDSSKSSRNARKGHFMDMVHPSSDANVQRKPNFAAERQSELDAKKLEQAEKTIDDTPSKISVVAIDEPADKGASIVTEVTEITQVIKTTKPTKTVQTKQLPITDLRPLEEAPVEPKPANVSPFIPGVKVEKKPLGSVNAEEVKTSDRIGDDIDRLMCDMTEQAQPDMSETHTEYHSSRHEKPVKKHSVLKTISWILLFIAVIILGALAGLALYYFAP